MPDNRPHLFPAATEHHHDDARAERERLAERVIAAIEDLCNLDRAFADDMGGVVDTIRMHYPESSGPTTSAGPEDPITPPKK